MCGITGWFNESIDHEKAKLIKLCRSIEHRGPNATNCVLFKKHSYNVNCGNVGLGHTRLSIIDLSNRANQPMCDSTKRYWIVFNGEIYNFKNIRFNILNNLGCQFTSTSDTEVLLYLYIHKKEQCLKYIDGIFAFAIFDMKEETLFCARDRFGIKPFYYYLKNNQFVFASELKPIYEYLNYEFTISDSAVVNYLATGYIGQKQTIANNIYKLEPAHYLKIGKDFVFKDVCYWNLDNSKIKNAENEINIAPEDHIVDRLENNLLSSVKDQIISDVPIGTFLSGGIDSTLVTILAKKALNGQTLSTFSIGFNEPQFNEAPYAKSIAQYLGTQHHELILNEYDFISIVKKLPEIYDEPFADSSSIPMFALSQFVKGQITVALSGDGGDEQMFGYTRYLYAQKLNKFYKIPYYFRKLLKNFNYLVNILGIDFYHILQSLTFENSLLANNNFGNLLSLLGNDNCTNKSMNVSYLKFENNLMLNDLNNYMIDDVLTKVDRASMYNGIEVRVPLLSHKVVEFSYHDIPLTYKIDKPTKYLYKSIICKYLPMSLIERPKKGFAIPLKKWVYKSLFKEIEESLKSNSHLYNYFDEHKIHNLLKMKESKYGAELLWRIYSFIEWENTYCKGKPI